MPVIHLYIYTKFVYIPECLSHTEFFVGLENSGEIETELLCGQFSFFQYEASSTVLCATKTLDRGSRQARKERTAVVKA